MDEKELKNVMVDLGMRKITEEEVHEMMHSNDSNCSGFIEWEEFVNMMLLVHKDDSSKFGKIIAGRAVIENVHGGKH